MHLARSTPPLLAFAFPVLIAVSLFACDDGTGSGSAGEPCSTKTFRCATPACSAFPTNPGCDDVAPTLGRCPLDHAHCFDPVGKSGFCNGTDAMQQSSGEVCAKRKDTAPMGCAATTEQLAGQCISSVIAQCADVDTSTVFCRNGYQCVRFNCEDGGVPSVDMAMSGDLSMPADMATSPDLARRD